VRPTYAASWPTLGVRITSRIRSHRMISRSTQPSTRIHSQAFSSSHSGSPNTASTVAPPAALLFLLAAPPPPLLRLPARVTSASPGILVDDRLDAMTPSRARYHRWCRYIPRSSLQCDSARASGSAPLCRGNEEKIDRLRLDAKGETSRGCEEAKITAHSAGLFCRVLNSK
jgi:hypothetical protein